MAIDIRAVHADLLATLAAAAPAANKPYTAFPWVVLSNMTSGFPRFFVETPSVMPEEDHEGLVTRAFTVSWNVFYVNKYETVTGDNPFGDIMNMIAVVMDAFGSDYLRRFWTTEGELQGTEVAVLADNAVNSWARDLKQPYAAVQFVIQAVMQE